MADQEKEQTYDRSGKKISFDDVVSLTSGLTAGRAPGIEKYMAEVMPSAQDRRNRTDIYRINKDALASIGKYLNYLGARYPTVAAKDQSKSGVILNPQALNFSGRPLDTDEINKVINHEMFHEFQGKNPGLTEKIADYVKNAGVSPALGYMSAGEALVDSGYGRNLFDVETQAHLGSKTMPTRPEEYYSKAIPNVIESPLRFKNRNMNVADPRVAEEFQRTVYPILPKKMQERFKSSFPSDVSPEMPKGFAQNAIDSFMSIIGLGAK